MENPNTTSEMARMGKITTPKLGFLSWINFRERLHQAFAVKGLKLECPAARSQVAGWQSGTISHPIIEDMKDESNELEIPDMTRR